MNNVYTNKQCTEIGKCVKNTHKRIKSESKKKKQLVRERMLLSRRNIMVVAVAAAALVVSDNRKTSENLLLSRDEMKTGKNNPNKRNERKC